MEINKSFSDNKMPVYMQVYKKVMSEIYDGKWKPGDRLPNDMEFAKELGLNHLTLKKALNRLASEGYFSRDISGNRETRSVARVIICKQQPHKSIQTNHGSFFRS